uniref:Anosmin 1 n=1 Tax=Echinococcus canadensis TaxID=519352 RepID=A0A915EXU9_9CEST
MITQMWVLSLLRWILMLLIALRLEAVSDAEQRAFLRAQCKAICLQYFGHPDDAAIKRIMNRLGVQSDLAFDCFQNQEGKCRDACFSACDDPPSHCQSTCSIGRVDSVGCHLGCLLLTDIHNNRPGECPIPGVPASEEEAGLFRLHSPLCRKLCVDDASCLHPLQKCCAFGCNRNCTMPIYSEAVPLLPPRPSLQPVREKPGTIQISWGGTYANFSRDHRPLVFILQTRFCICKSFTEEQASPWQTLLMAVKTEATVDTFEPGHKYQFRLAAVSTQGSRGFGPASRPYPLSPSRPQPPRNVTATKWRIHPNGEVSVRLSWTQPESTDLPLINYSVSWALDSGYPTATSGKPLKDLGAPFMQSVQTKDSEITINSLRPGSSYKVQVTANYFHDEGNLQSLPHNFFISTQSLLPPYRQQNMAFENVKHLPTAAAHGGNNGDSYDGNYSDDSSTCRCSGLTRNDERLEIQPPEVFNGDLTALVQLKSFSHMDTQSYRIEWFPQVCIESIENAPTLTSAVSYPTTINAATGSIHSVNTGSEVITATVRSRIFRLTKLKFNCVYVVRLTPEEAADVRLRFESLQQHEQRHLVKATPSSASSSSSGAAGDVVAGCFCTRSCRETKTAWSTEPIDCPAAEPELPKPPRDIQVKLVSYDRLDYQVSWRPPLPTKASAAVLTSGTSHPASAAASSTAFTRYRVMLAPRKEEPVDASMYNDEAGFSPIPDLQHSDVRVLDKNQTSLILPRLRPRTFYIVRIQTLGGTDFGVERESPPAVHYFSTHDDDFHSSGRTNGFFVELASDRGASGPLVLSPWLVAARASFNCDLKLPEKLTDCHIHTHTSALNPLISAALLSTESQTDGITFRNTST